MYMPRTSFIGFVIRLRHKRASSHRERSLLARRGRVEIQRAWYDSGAAVGDIVRRWVERRCGVEFGDGCVDVGDQREYQRPVRGHHGSKVVQRRADRSWAVDG